MQTLERFMPVWNAEGGGEGGGDAGEGGAGEGGAGSGGGWTPPEGLPKDFIGADASETLGKLLTGYQDVDKRFSGLREKLAGMPKPPDSPEGYEYEPSEKLKGYFGDLDKNPVFKQAREAFHKHGVPAAQFSGVIEDLYGPLIEQGLLPEPFDPAREVNAFQQAYGMDRDKAAAALTEAEVFAKGLSAQLKDVPEAMKQDVADMMMGLTDTAAGNVLLRALSGRLAENGIRVSGDGGEQGMLSKSDLQKLDGDPRVDPRNRDNPDPDKRFDPDLRARYDQAYQHHYPPKKSE
jgi:hypothetical protein